MKRVSVFAVVWIARLGVLAATAFGLCAVIPGTGRDWIAAAVSPVLLGLGVIVKVPPRQPRSKPAQPSAPSKAQPATPARPNR